MRSLAIIVACSLWMCIDCNAHAESASSIAKACAPVRDVIDYTAQISGVPRGLLMALFFAESTCRPDAENGQAIGIGQVLLTGAGAGYTREQLLDPWTNASVAAAHMWKWRRRCGNWRGAVEVYGGYGTCRNRSDFGAKVVRYWKMIEREEMRKS